MPAYDVPFTCLYCPKDISFFGLPANDYIEHLENIHKLESGIENVIEKTLKLRLTWYRPKNFKPKKSLKNAATQTDLFDVSTLSTVENLEKDQCIQTSDSDFNAPPLVVVSSSDETNETNNCLDVNEFSKILSELSEKEKHRPWHDGCEFRCMICKKMHYHHNELRDHIKYQHTELQDSDEYVDNYGEFETKTVYINCLICKQSMKATFKGVCKHLESCHIGLKIEEYSHRFNLTYFKDNFQNPDLINENKKRRLSNNPNDGGENKRSRNEQQILNPKWYEGCEFQCQICFITYLARKDLVEHIEDEHAMYIKSYTTKYGATNTKKTTYKCRICNTSIFHSYESVRRHIRSEHGKTLLQYQKEYHPEVTEDDPNLNVSLITEERLPDEYYRFYDNKSSYICKIKTCDYKTTCYDNFSKHAMSKHSLNQNAYLRRYGDPTEYVTKYKCPLCESIVVYERIPINKHNKQVHKMSSEEFFKQHLKNNKIPEGFQESVKKEPCITSSQQRISSPTSSISSVKENLQSPANHLRNPIINEQNSNLISVNIVKEVNEWSNKCTYTCKICGKITQDASNMSKHIFMTHKMDIKAYNRDHGETVSSKVYHNCKSCGEFILWSQKEIKQHARNRHQISLNTYYLKYIREKDGSELLAIKENLHKLSPPNYSSWMSNKHYFCKICNINFETALSTNAHIIQMHDREEYVMKFGSILAVKDKWICEICSKEVGHNRTNIAQHLHSHELTMWQYYIKYVQLKWEIGKGEKQKDILTSNSYNTTKEKNKPITTDNEEDSKDIDVSKQVKNWGNGCVYECKICKANGEPKIKYFFKDQRFANYHIHKLHKLNAKSYQEKYGDFMILNKQHTCRICRKSVIHKYEGLKAHLALHGRSIFHYYKNFIANSLNKEKSQKQKAKTLPAPLVSKPQTLSNPLPSPIQQVDTTLGLESQNRDQSISEHNYHSISLNDSIDPLSLPTSQSWMNRCVYTCNLCNESLSSKSDLRIHLSSVHKIDYSEYNSKMNSNDVLELFVCEICKKIMDHDEEDIRDHLRIHHSLTPEDYQKKYVKEESTNEDANATSFDWNQNVYSCPICQMKLFNYKQCYKHIHKNHRGKKGTVQTLIGRQHTCLICKNQLKFERENLTRHFRNVHKKTLLDYENEYFDQLNDIFDSLKNDTDMLLESSLNPVEQYQPFDNLASISYNNSIAIADEPPLSPIHIKEEPMDFADFSSIDNSELVNENLDDNESMINGF